MGTARYLRRPFSPLPMRHAVVLLVVLAATSGCMTYSVPPHSTLSTHVGHDALDVTGASLAVVLDASTFAVDDADGVLTHVGDGDDARTVLHALVANRFPLALKSEAPFGEVYVVDSGAGEIASEDLTPEAGTTVDAAGRTPDFVLYVDSLHQYRARYQGGAGMFGNAGNPAVAMGGGVRMAVRNDVDYRLWDNRTRQLAASGRVESEETIALVLNRRVYVGAVEEMAEKLAQELQIRTQ